MVPQALSPWTLASTTQGDRQAVRPGKQQRDGNRSEQQTTNRTVAGGKWE
jgi:hypothetical protein